MAAEILILEIKVGLIIFAGCSAGPGHVLENQNDPLEFLFRLPEATREDKTLGHELCSGSHPARSEPRQ